MSTSIAERSAPTGEVDFVQVREKGGANTARSKLAEQKRVEYGPQKTQYDYYDFGPILSHNATFNLIIGERGVGKSYGAKKLAIKRFINRGEMFVYVRRYGEELIARETFFADIAHEFPDWQFRANGNEFQAAKIEYEFDDHGKRKQKRLVWQTFGYAIALSTAQKNKSQAYPLVTLMIYEEVILEKGFVRYIPGEVNALLSLYSTIDRGQDKTKVLMLANAVSEMNPYSLEWGIKRNPNREITTYDDGMIAAHFPKSENYTKQFLQTKFGRFVEKREYAKYAVHNEFADHREQFVEEKNPKAIFQFNLQTRNGWVSVWRTLTPFQYYISRTLPQNQLSFTMLPEKMNPGMMLLMYNDDQIKRLRTLYRTDRMRFDSSQAENIFLDLFSKKQ